MPVEKSKSEARCRQWSSSGASNVASGKKRKKKKKVESAVAAGTGIRGAKFAQGAEKKEERLLKLRSEAGTFMSQNSLAM